MAEAPNRRGSSSSSEGSASGVPQARDTQARAPSQQNRSQQPAQSSSSDSSPARPEQPAQAPPTRRVVHHHYHRIQCCDNHNTAISAHLHALAPVSNDPAQVPRPAATSTPEARPPSYEQATGTAEARPPLHSRSINSALPRPNAVFDGSDLRHFLSRPNSNNISNCPEPSASRPTGSPPAPSTSRRGDSRNQGWEPMDVLSPPRGSRQVRRSNNNLIRSPIYRRESRSSPYRRRRSPASSDRASGRQYPRRRACPIGPNCRKCNNTDTRSWYDRSRYSPEYRNRTSRYQRSPARYGTPPRQRSPPRYGTPPRLRSPPRYGSSPRLRTPPRRRTPPRCRAPPSRRVTPASSTRNSPTNHRRGSSIRCGASAAGVANLFRNFTIRSVPQGSRTAPIFARPDSGLSGSIRSASGHSNPAAPAAAGGNASPPGSPSSSSTTTGVSSSEASLITTNSTASNPGRQNDTFFDQLSQQPPFNLTPAELDSTTFGNLVNSGRLRIRRLFLTEIVRIRQDQQVTRAADAYHLFVDRAIATGSFTTELQVGVAWYYAFRSWPTRLFGHFFRMAINQLRAEMLNESP